eukprot:7572466-Karenia_brevis.AAC.1
MLDDIVVAAGRRGLILHPKKTKVLCNVSKRRGRAAQDHIEVQGMRIEVLPFDGEVKYLGCKLTFNESMATEIDYRITQAWKAFMTLKSAL